MPGTTTPVSLAGDVMQDPYSFYRRLREEAPVREARMPRGLKVWVVTRYADAREALANPALHKDMRQMYDLIARHSRSGGRGGFGPELAAHMLNSDPPDHTRLRKLVAAAFTMRRVEQLRPRVEEITEDLLASLPDRADLVEDFAFPLPVTVISELLGIPHADRDDFRGWTTILLSTAESAKIAAAGRAMTGYLRGLIAAKRSDPAEDMLSALTNTRDEDGDSLTETELVSMAFLLLVAGHETTVNLIGNATLALLRHPGQLAALRDDPTLLPGAVEEFLRYDGPLAHATLRYTVEPVEIGGVRIPADEFVLVALGSANRDGDRFTDGEELDITRGANGHLAFGHGIHFCLGAPLARLEGQVAIGRLIDRFPNLALDADPADLRWRESNLMRGLESLPVRLR
ncbi:cytochrome P450 [Actinophytocola sp.]|uniref:cytochrome P450 family protein n=1 Tax=Actinophytocola sp. TaxID=1872138 RepID=UPI002D22A2D9|nr:cytochrome P450 [Actinophytocola sp.]HYQ68185.1 cytochrome P450 [Actinophytocola sp.]